ncbi:hypothetical protein EXIGLDRAFT_842905 [Exidia glandulosa HHB12029]|uniref:Uncharacterized protein n=1 Tax=Exidia glandulosa HHB12029 TaxID=1314781 RepID=A0A165CZJ5_EXIGL|nr:hypothetical protein EXIGLDRAFT_842905 [Exidia glandulosa HHB12029]
MPITADDGTILCSWANNPDTRGTLNIIWLCVSTLGLCVWNAVHPDVPYPGSPKWRVIGERIWWLFVGLFMPEMLVLTALAQYRQAYTLLVRVSRETCVPTKMPWWIVLVERLWPTPLTGKEIDQRVEFLPFSVRCEAILPPLSSVELEDLTALIPAHTSELTLSVTPPTPRKDAAVQTNHAAEAQEWGRKHAWTLTHSFYAVMHGFLSAEGDAFWRAKKYRGFTGDFYPLFDADMGIQCITAAFRIPDLSADDLNDRSKAGTIAKALLVWQLSVFIANCAARWNQHLPLSLLEITTLAHSLCSLIALVLWWYKPHSVGEATVSDRATSLPPPRKGAWFNGVYQKVLPGNDGIDIPRTITILGIAVLYGLPHILGLSVHFPTSPEQLLWQMATYIAICSPLIICAFLWIITRLTWRLGRKDYIANQTLALLIMILVVLYLVASMYLVGESVRQVFALPDGSFHEPQITRYLPSFS